MSEQSRPSASMIVATVGSKEFKAKVEASVPKGVDVDRFTRMTITAIQGNPDLLEADKESLYLAILQCAQTGLAPDGKKAALVIFNTKTHQGGKEVWVKKVQMMPMVAGVVDKLGEVGVKCDTAVVHELDTFEWEQGDHPRITHKPARLGTDRGVMIGAYAILRLKDGDVYHEVMDSKQIEAVRAQSRAPNSLMWTKFYEEGCRKTVLRRCAKRVPMPYDKSVEATLEADNATFDMETRTPAKEDPTVVATQQPKEIEQVAPETDPQRVPVMPVQTEIPVESENPAPPSAAEPTRPARPRALQQVVATTSDDDDVF